MVIQQGQDAISGYTNLSPCESYEDLVLFGDHTLSLYKPQSPFCVASDGVKCFYSKITNGLYLFYLLEKSLPENEGYKRYSSILKHQISYVCKNKNEQYKIGSIFNTLDNLITLHQRKCK